MTIKLSFCIPTYNRAAFIGETIESIISQTTDEVEIIISDNASTDNTGEIVRSYQRRFPYMTYFRWDENMGADRNYLKAVELAKGEYCWLMGSDDALKPGAISRIIKEIKYGYDIYLCNRTECDIGLIPIRDRFWLIKSVSDRVYDLSNEIELINYLNNSQSIGALFSYLSSIVFLRKKWNQIKYDEIFTGSAYSHVYMLLSFIRKGCILKYINDNLILCRGGNDSFARQGFIKRFLLDIDGYKLLADKLFNDNLDIKIAFLKVMTRWHSWGSVAAVRYFSKNIIEWKMIESKLKIFGYNAIILYIFRYIKFILPVIRYFRSKIRPFLYKLNFCSTKHTTEP